MSRNDEHNREALALDALGALDGDERRALSAHLAACPECRRERDELRDVAALLAYAAPPVAPPAALRARLLERVRAPGQAVGPTTAASASGDAETLTLDRDAAQEDARVLKFARRPPARGFRLSKSLALAASIVLAVMAVALAALWSQNRGLRGELARLGAESEAARMELARQREELARREAELAREREVAELLAAPETRVAALAGTPEAPGARASLAYDRATGRAVLRASGLPPAPEGKAYQVWYIAAGKPPMPGPVFKTDETGRGTLRDEIPAEGRAASTFAVTLEPESGVSAPTGKMFLLSAVSIIPR